MVELTLESAAIGICGLIAANFVLRATLNLYKTFLRPAKPLKKYGKWAVVTGATGTSSTYMHSLLDILPSQYSEEFVAFGGCMVVIALDIHTHAFFLLFSSPLMLCVICSIFSTTNNDSGGRS